MSDSRWTKWAKKRPKRVAAGSAALAALCSYLIVEWGLSNVMPAQAMNWSAAGLTAVGLLTLFAADLLAMYQHEGKQTASHWATLGHALVILAAALAIGAYFAK